MANRQSMFHNKMEAWGARAISKVGVNWERGWRIRAEITFIVSTVLFSTFLPMAITQVGGDDMTGLWIVFAILTFWAMSACIWLSVRYSGRTQNKRLDRQDKRLANMENSLSEMVKLLRSLVEKVG